MEKKGGNLNTDRSVSGVWICNGIWNEYSGFHITTAVSILTLFIFYM
jgi:hypothetical protein